MAAENADVRAAVMSQSAHAVLVAVVPVGVDRHHALVGAGTGRALAMLAVHLVTVVVVVGSVEEPTLGRPDGDAGMTPSVAGHRNHQDFGRQPIEIAHGLEAEPALAAGAVGPPAPHRVPLLGPVAAASQKGVSLPCGLPLGGHDVNGGVWKVFKSAGVVEIEVGQD